MKQCGGFSRVDFGIELTYTTLKDKMYRIVEVCRTDVNFQSSRPSKSSWNAAGGLKSTMSHFVLEMDATHRCFLLLSHE